VSRPSTGTSAWHRPFAPQVTKPSWHSHWWGGQPTVSQSMRGGGRVTSSTASVGGRAPVRDSFTAASVVSWGPRGAGERMKLREAPLCGASAPAGVQWGTPRRAASLDVLSSVARPPRLLLGFLAEQREPFQVHVFPSEKDCLSGDPLAGKPTFLGHALGGQVPHHDR